MARLKDLAAQAGEIQPEEGKTLQRTIQDTAGVYDGRSDRRSKYGEPEIIRAVALYKLYQNFEAVSRETGIPPSVIHAWVSGTTNVLAKVGNLQEKVEQAYNSLIDNSIFLMTEAQQQIHKRLPDASAAQAATIYGILADKTRYMSEGSRQQTGTSLHFNLAGLSADEQGALMDRVIQRQQQRDEERAAIDAEYTTVSAVETEPTAETETEAERQRQRQREEKRRLSRADKKLRKALQ